MSHRSFALILSVPLSLHLHAFLRGALEYVCGDKLLLSLHLQLECISCGSLLRVAAQVEIQSKT